MVELTEIKPAGFWARLAAHAVDGWLFLASGFVLVYLSGLAQILFHLSTGLVGFLALAALALLWLLNAAYYVYWTKNGGQTWGKKFLGIKVVDVGGGDVSYGQAFVRWAGYSLSYSALYLGYLMAGITSGKRALHDVLAKTRVVEAAVPRSRGLIAVLAAAGLIPALVPVFLGGSAYYVVRRTKTHMEAAQEAETRRGLRSLRNAVEIYRLDKALYPASLNDPQFLGPYLSVVPPVRLARTGHAPSAEVETGDYGAAGGGVDPAKVRDSGRWGYDPAGGLVFIDCGHKDLDGRPVYAW